MIKLRSAFGFIQGQSLTFPSAPFQAAPDMSHIVIVDSSNYEEFRDWFNQASKQESHPACHKCLSEKVWQNYAEALHPNFINWPVYQGEDKHFLALGMCGEAGEVANKVKKQWRGDPVVVQSIWEELADVRVYWHLLTHAYGAHSTMDKIIMDNLRQAEAKLKQRKEEQSNGGKRV